MNNSLEPVLKRARQTGKLSIPNREITTVPEDVWKISALTFGEKWWELVQITHIDLSHNSILTYQRDNSVKISQSSNPSTLLTTDWLLFLRLCSLNQLLESTLDSTSSQISCSKNLLELSLNNNKLRTIPEQIGGLSALNNLNLSHNVITDLGGVGKLGHLATLVLNNNRLPTIPSGVGQMRNLTSLEIHCNEISSLCDIHYKQRGQRIRREEEWPKREEIQKNRAKEFDYIIYMSALVGLMRLNLHSNKLASLPPLPNSLVELFLGTNKFTQFPEVVCSCTKLSVLDVNTNKISEVPAIIAKLTLLKRLDLSNNELVNLPPEMGLMTKLDGLVVDGNPLKSIRRDVIAKGAKPLLAFLRTRLPDVQPDKSSLPSSALPSASSSSVSRDARSKGALDLSNRKLGEIPADTFDIPDLVTLKLAKNQIQNIPESITKLADSLQMLDISGNRLSSLPMELASCNKLTEITLSQNQLPSFSPEVFQNVRALDLRANKISSIPSSINSLASLQILLLSANLISSLPAELFTLPSLQHLDLSSNKLDDISPAITQLTTLTILDVSNNNLVNLPSELGLMTSLRGLEIQGRNMIKSIRAAVIAKGAKAILEALRLKLGA